MAESKARELSKLGSITTTKGQIIVANGGDFSSLSAGADDQVLTVDAAETTGLKWAAGGGGGGGSAWTLVETLNPGSVNSITTTATIPASAEEFLVVFRDVSHNSGSSQRFYIDFPDVTISLVEGWSYNTGGASTAWSGYGYPITHTQAGTAQLETRWHGIRIPGTNEWSVFLINASSTGVNPHVGHGTMTVSASALGAVKIGVEGGVALIDNSPTIHVSYK